MMEAKTHSIDIGQGKVITLETGKLAKQAGGAVIARLGDTMVLCTAVSAEKPRAGMDFFPLTVDYREKYSAGGKIPGGFLKREARPTDKEVLSSRLVDRAIRPLFPDGFRNEVQVLLNVISADGENDADVVAGVGASAALCLSPAPFAGPIGEVRVGRLDGEFVINPTISELQESDFDLIVAGTADALLMVEGEMEEVSEDEMIEALEFAQNTIRILCEEQEKFFDVAGRKQKMAVEDVGIPEELLERVQNLIGERMISHVEEGAYQKEEFYGGVGQMKEDVLDALLGTTDPTLGLIRAESTEEGYTPAQILDAVTYLEKTTMRHMILDSGKRIDGRGAADIRDIWSEVGYLPRVHGSAIFTRGETQALASVTLGTSKDVQAVDQIFDTEDKRFYLHYNFPPFSTGEAKPMRGVSRREVGHGYLAERALTYVLPPRESFPYTIRLISDILESNGSSSMASVCAGSMAMMDAGVPLSKPVAGIAMGLIKEGERVAILSDILGTEDFLGDMDFKVAGTRDGITACQMDIKVTGISGDVMRRAMDQAKVGRDHILNKMDEVISEPRPELSAYAPRLTELVIDADFIGAVIGPGGKIIQGLQRDTNTKIEIEERDGKGHVIVAAVNQEDSRAAVDRIRQIVALPEPGEDYVGTVRSIQPFGAIVEILPGKEGLLHISEVDYGYVDKVDEYFQVGDKVQVRLVEIRDDGKLRLSRKPFLEKPEGYEEREQSRERPRREGNGRDRDRSGHGQRGHGRGGDRRGGERRR